MALVIINIGKPKITRCLMINRTSDIFELRLKDQYIFNILTRNVENLMIM